MESLAARAVLVRDFRVDRARHQWRSMLGLSPRASLAVVRVKMESVVRVARSLRLPTIFYANVVAAHLGIGGDYRGPPFKGLLPYDRFGFGYSEVSIPPASVTRPQGSVQR